MAINLVLTEDEMEIAVRTATDILNSYAKNLIKDGKVNEDALITYSKLADKLNSKLVPGKFTARNLNVVLGEISTRTHTEYGLMLTAIVVRKNGKYPGPGFFNLAEDLYRSKFGDSERSWWEKHCKKISERALADNRNNPNH